MADIEPQVERRSTETRLAIVETKLDFSVAQNDRIEKSLDKIHTTLKEDLVPLKEKLQNLKGALGILAWIGSILSVLVVLFKDKISSMFH